MSRTSRSLFKAGACALGLALLGVFSAATQAASINYGDFGPVPPGVSFLGVTESSGTDPVPIYGPPSAFSVGLDFDPTNFVATTSSGGADITDGQLNLTVTANAGIGSISLQEAGDYTLAGVGTPATSVLAGAVIFATVTQINGANVAPINLAPVNGSVGFALPPAAITQPWSLGLSVNVTAQLAAQGFNASQRATRIELAVNNTLVATSEPGSVAFMAKKEFRLSTGVIPEPASAGLMGVALCALAAAARKRG
jgi:hypothetical protein